MLGRRETTGSAGIAYQANASEPGMEQGPVWGSLTQLQSTINRLTDSVAHLHSRLDPILAREPVPLNKSSTPETPPPCGGVCDYQDALIEANRRLEMIESQIVATTRRLAI